MLQNRDNLSAMRQTDGTDDMKVMRCSSSKAPNRMMMSGRNGGVMYRSCPDSHGNRQLQISP